MPGSWRRVAVLFALVLVPSLALAYGVAIHDLLPRRALASLPGTGAAAVRDDTLPGIADADLAAFRLFLYERASRLSDTAVRRAFLARYPTAAAFDERAMKELLMMNGAAHVMGVDPFAVVYGGMRAQDRRQDPHPDYVAGRPLTLLTALELGSIYPDLDRRNQARLARDAALAPLRTAAGDSVPFDPMSLNMGKLAGLSSQAHAHYGLNRHTKSDDPKILKTAPWDFAIATAVPGQVETYAPDNAQLYTDLALIAALDGRPAWRALGALYAGNAMHYLADVGNAVHTIQVGIYPIFVDATIQSWILRVVHLFGLLGTPPTRNAIGLDIISNLHTLSEQLFQAQLTEALAGTGRPGFAPRPASIDAALRSLAAGDDSLGRALRDTLRTLGDGADFGRAIAVVVVDANCRDGAEVYRVTRDIADTRLRIGRRRVDFDTVPDDQLWRWVRVHRGAMIHTELDDFNAVHARGLARTTTALRTWWAQYAASSAVPAAQRPARLDAVVARLIAERLRYLAQAEQRRREWLAQHP